MLSVVIPTIGRDSLETVLLSIADQSIEKITIILIDDSETGLSNKRILNISENNSFELVYLRTAGMIGPAKARNLGLQNIKTKWVAFADDDDPWTEFRLEKQIASMKQLNLNASVLLDFRKGSHKFLWEGGMSPLFFLYENRGFKRSSKFIPFGTLLYDFEIYKNVRFKNELQEREDLWFLHELFVTNQRIKQLPIIGCQVTRDRFRSIRRPTFVDDEIWFTFLAILDKKLAHNFLIYISLRNSFATLNFLKIAKIIINWRRWHK